MLGYWRNNQCAICPMFRESLIQLTDSLKSHIPHPELLTLFPAFVFRVVTQVASYQKAPQFKYKI